jgi:hypothetical protein
MQIQFGTGALLAIPNAGNLAANPTPQQFGILQEASIEFKGALKKLYGQNQYSIASARGKVETTGKAKLALLDPNMLNQLFFGQTQSTGVSRMAYNESHTTAASVTVTHAPSGSPVTPITDYGVVNGDTGLNMIKVDSNPTAGQYTVNASTGQYGFNASETAKSVLISYTYADTTGVTISLSNQLMGYSPYFQLFLYNNFRNKYFAAEFYQANMGGISLPTKQEDFWIMDVDFSMDANAAGLVGKLYADV